MRSASRSIKLILLLFVAISLVVGCSNANNSTNNTPKAETPSEVAELKPYEVTLVMPGAPLKDHDLVIGEMNKILKEKINATLNLHYVDWGAWAEKTNLMFASSEPFDLIFSAGWFGHFFTCRSVLGKNIAPDVACCKRPACKDRSTLGFSN